jgi:hypothetical protein
MLSNKLTKFIAAGAAAVAVATGGLAIANSNSSNGTSGTATAAQTAPAQAGPRAQTGASGQAGVPAKGSGGAWAPAGAGAFGQVPKGWSPGTGTIITGAAADKAKTSAIAANYSGTVNRVLKLSDGSYVVHLIGTQGVHHVFVNTDFKVVGAE